MFGQMGRLQQFGRVDLKVSVDHEVMVERAYPTEDARLAFGPYAPLVDPSGKALQVVELHVDWREALPA